ncbi:MAG TPA: hypothetical protein VFQ75_10445 [Candidatus Limnocylindrales bacterium]|nr:hypothetical protein [Candidatus Limnocylindrales bacterium]
MTLHLPAQHAGTSGHELVRDVLIVGAVVLATVVVLWASVVIRQSATTTAVDQAQSIIEYRAAERAQWSGTVPVVEHSNPNSIIERRAE